ncbi:MAG: hypothetical protein C0617_00130 [Desulfuromonas sp.]|uniref:PAS domain-containing sensor histidine kinase n=1 Tax=Desulfuromonas sp. TaxID=892 RepID=UPI000CB8123D|nr:ATP-binding protein [Desulfuromonas sp.]PLX86655.1 MAG: hypothetical protein C0617_00130 [Desulfuromonas sp.]
MLPRTMSCPTLIDEDPAALRAEIERLKGENAQLREREGKDIRYIREKVDQLLATIGTAPLKAEELDDETLLTLDPIGIINDAFVQVLDHLREANRQMSAARDEARAVLDTAATGILVLDRRRRALTYNHKFRQLFLEEGDETTGWSCREKICGGSSPPPVCVFERVIESGQTEERNDWVFEDRCFQVAASPIRDGEGAVERVVLAFSEITDKQRAERQLLEAKARLRAILNGIHAGVLVIDARRHVIVDVNRSAAEMIGESEERIRGSACHSYVCPAEEGKCPITDLGHRVDNSERVLLTADGRSLPVLKTVRPMMLGDEEYLIESFVDITARKTAEEGLRLALSEAQDARTKIDGILSSVTDPLFVADLAGRIVLMNEAAGYLLGVPRTLVLGRPLAAVLGDTALRSQLEKTLARGEEGERFDFTLPGQGERDGTVFQGRTFPLRGAGGGRSGTVVYINDVTREREVERMKSEFVSTAAHELQTPLTAIFGFAELLLEQEDLAPELRRESLTFIYERSEALSKIVDDLLDTSRIESGRRLDLHREPCDFTRLLKDVVGPYDLRSSRHRLELDLPPDPVELPVDRRRMGQVLENLLSNATKYSPEGGVVRVNGHLENEFYRVTVEDEGIGMTPEQVERVFEKFYRGDASNTAIGGTGLGMSIVKHIVEAHGGKIRVESEPEEGTRVVFRVPLGPGASGLSD